MTSVAPPPTWPAPPDPPELPAGAPPTETVPPWRWFHGVTGFISWFVAVNVVASVIILAATGGDADDPPPAATISATVVQDALLIGAAVLFARLAAGGLPTRAWHFGLRKARLWSSVGWTTLTYVSFVAFSAAWVAALGIDEEDNLPEELGVDESDVALAATAILVTVIAPIAEELFFRGFLFPAFRRSMGLWAGAIATGVVFGGIHVGSSPIGFIVPLMVLGFALCLLYVQTKSLYPPIALHCVNNSIAFGVGVDWDWQILPLMFGALAVIGLCAVLVRRATGPAPPHLSPV